MKLLSRIRDSYGALRILYRLSGLLNLFCPRFDRVRNSLMRSQAALPPGPLNGQNLAPLSDLPYGAWHMGRNGCEVIAVYNALLALRIPRTLEDIAAAMEKRGLLFNGFGGTNLAAVANYLRDCGVNVCILKRRDRSKYDMAFKNAECAVLSFWTGTTLRIRKGVWNTLHTVSVYPAAKGVQICNADGMQETATEVPSIGEFLAEDGKAPVCLMLLTRKKYLKN